MKFVKSFFSSLLNRSFCNNFHTFLEHCKRDIANDSPDKKNMKSKASVTMKRAKALKKIFVQ